jgi:hypothetical protein
VVEAPDALPRVLAGDRQLRGAMAALLAECLRQGPAEIPGRIALEQRGDVVVVRLIDPASALPDADTRLLSQAPEEFDPGSHLYRLARARRQVERAAGEFSIESGLGSGTVIEIRLPIASKG